MDVEGGKSTTTVGMMSSVRDVEMLLLLKQKGQCEDIATEFTPEMEAILKNRWVLERRKLLLLSASQK